MRLWYYCLETWWRHKMGTFSALLAPCAGNSPVTGEFPAQRPVTRRFDVFFDLRLNKRLSNNREAGDLRRHRALYDVTVMNDCITSHAHAWLLCIILSLLHFVIWKHNWKTKKLLHFYFIYFTSYFRLPDRLCSFHYNFFIYCLIFI